MLKTREAGIFRTAVIAMTAPSQEERDKLTKQVFEYLPKSEWPVFIRCCWLASNNMTPTSSEELDLKREKDLLIDKTN